MPDIDGETLAASELASLAAIEQTVASSARAKPAVRSELDLTIDEHWHRMVFATTPASKLLWGERYTAAVKQRRALQ